MKHVALPPRAPLWPRLAPALPHSARPAPARPVNEPPAPERQASERAVSGVYPSPFGFVLSVPVARSERLVPIAAAHAAALTPVTSALGLVRDCGGFEVDRVSLPTVEARLTFGGVPDLARAKRRVAVLARDLLALGSAALPARQRLRFRPAMELCSSGASTLSISVYGEGPLATDEDSIRHLAQAMLPALSRLIDASASCSTQQLVRQRVRVGCRVALDALLARVAARRRREPARERNAVHEALEWFAAARWSSALASAQNDIVLTAVADVARALGQNRERVLAEGQRHACRFGAVAPLVRFELDSACLAGSLLLPSGLEQHGRRHGAPSELAHRLLLGHSAEEVAQLSACVGLAAHLASLKAAVSLAWSGAIPARPVPKAKARAPEQPTPRAAARSTPLRPPSPSSEPSTQVTRRYARPWALLQRPRSAPSERHELHSRSLDETRVMPLQMQRALVRRGTPGDASERPRQTPRRAPGAPPRERR